MIFRADGQQNFLHLSQSGSITILPVFDCGCRAPSRTSESWLIDHLLAWSIFNAPFDKITFSRVRDLHFLAAGPAKRRDLFRCYYMKERHPKASLSLPRWLVWFLFRDDGKRQSHRVCGSDHTTTDLFHNSCLQIGHCTVNYVGEKNALIWIKARRKKTVNECFPCITEILQNNIWWNWTNLKGRVR